MERQASQFIILLVGCLARSLVPARPLGGRAGRAVEDGRMAMSKETIWYFALWPDWARITLRRGLSCGGFGRAGGGGGPTGAEGGAPLWSDEQMTRRRTATLCQLSHRQQKREEA